MTTMTTEITANRYSTAITSARIDGYKGTQKAFILSFIKQCELYNDIAKVPYSDPQLVQFMKISVNSAPNLSQVYETNHQARVTAGNTREMTLAEYSAKLLQAAEYHDAQNTHASPTKLE